MLNNRETDVPMIAWIHLDEIRSGMKTRSSYPEKRKDLTPISLISKTINFTGNLKINVMRTQFPLLPAFAMTIHKSQGQSYDKVSVHARSGMSRALLYVALSRARTLNGLLIHLKGSKTFQSVLPKQSTSSTVSVDEEIFRLRQNLVVPVFGSLRKTRPFMVYQNIQSYNCNATSTMNDSIFRESDILVFVETWLSEKNVIELPSLHEVYRLDCSEQRGKGIMIAWRNTVNVQPLSKKRYFECDRSIDLLSFKVDNSCVMVVYKQCGMPENVMVDLMKRFIEEFNITPTIIVGDFNSDLKNGTSPLKVFIKKLNLKSLLEPHLPTTATGTTIDGAFGSDGSLKGVLYENLISHHYPIVFKEC